MCTSSVTLKAGRSCQFWGKKKKKWNECRADLVQCAVTEGRIEFGFTNWTSFHSQCPKVLYIQYNESDARSGGKHSSHCGHKNSSHVAFYIRICFSRRMLALGMLLILYSSVSWLPRDAELPPGQPLREWFQESVVPSILIKKSSLCSIPHIPHCISDCMTLFFLFFHLGPWLIEHMLVFRLFLNLKTG